jgi:hypothetical protein
LIFVWAEDEVVDLVEELGWQTMDDFGETRPGEVSCLVVLDGESISSQSMCFEGAGSSV